VLKFDSKLTFSRQFSVHKASFACLNSSHAEFFVASCCFSSKTNVQTWTIKNALEVFLELEIHLFQAFKYARKKLGTSFNRLHSAARKHRKIASLIRSMTISFSKVNVSSRTVRVSDYQQWTSNQQINYCLSYMCEFFNHTNTSGYQKNGAEREWTCCCFLNMV